LNVVCLSKGYGNGWIKTIAEKFEEEHPGYTVNLENAIAEAPALIKSNINSKNNIDDLYISVGNDWKTYAAQGKFAPLDDLIEAEVDGVKIKDKVASEYAESIYFPDRNGDVHSYRLPWTAGVGGIYYNTKMFETYGWQVPETYDELIALCDLIVEENIEFSSGGTAKTVKPFVYTGQNIDYFDYTVYTWWAQLSGEDNIKEFMQYASADNYDYTKNETYANLKKATEMWQAIFNNPAYVMEDCNGMSNHTAQTSFNNGYAAMMFNGDWVYNEILNYQIDNDGFGLGLMKTPVAPGAVETNITYTIGEDQYIAIPASSIKQDLAKEFIKLMVSDYGCGVFLNEAHGLLAYKSNLTADDTDDAFMKNLLTVKNSYSKAFTNYPAINGTENITNTTKMLYLSSMIDIWGTGALRPYGKLVGNNAKTTAEAFTDIANEISRQWQTWKTQAGIK
ncbi:MAG: extracellular solute-binding protein, partial [Clostridia bacterium]|nr:extracellular solute-binding protein [Clostridia bacterium]